MRGVKKVAHSTATVATPDAINSPTSPIGANHIPLSQLPAGAPSPVIGRIELDTFACIRKGLSFPYHVSFVSIRPLGYENPHEKPDDVIQPDCARFRTRAPPYHHATGTREHLMNLCPRIQVTRAIKYFGIIVGIIRNCRLAGGVHTETTTLPHFIEFPSFEWVKSWTRETGGRFD